MATSPLAPVEMLCFSSLASIFHNIKSATIFCCLRETIVLDICSKLCYKKRIRKTKANVSHGLLKQNFTLSRGIFCSRIML